MENNLKTNPNYKNGIKCPNCGSINISFVTEAHKCIVLKIINTLVAVVFIITCFTKLTDIINGTLQSSAITVLSIFGSAFVIINIIIYFFESKTHVQAICRDCGNLWLLN